MPTKNFFIVELWGATYDKEEMEIYGSSIRKHIRVRLDEDLKVVLIEVPYSFDSSYDADEYESITEFEKSPYSTKEFFENLPFLVEQ